MPGSAPHSPPASRPASGLGHGGSQRVSVGNSQRQTLEKKRAAQIQQHLAEAREAVRRGELRQGAGRRRTRADARSRSSGRLAADRRSPRRKSVTASRSSSRTCGPSWLRDTSNRRSGSSCRRSRPPGRSGNPAAARDGRDRGRELDRARRGRRCCAARGSVSPKDRLKARFAPPAKSSRSIRTTPPPASCRRAPRRRSTRRGRRSSGMPRRRPSSPRRGPSSKKATRTRPSGCSRPSRRRTIS